MTINSSRLEYPPRVTQFLKPFWDKLRQGVFTTTQCLDCGHTTFPPKFICPNCWSQNIRWIDLKGHGILRSFTEVWAAPLPFRHKVPYVLGLIDLDEGIRCLSELEGRYEDYQPDQEVELIIRESEPVPLFMFRSTDIKETFS
ncbi:MAG: Zn-ribbon domain-containing OB-fold protein [Alicyclobacillus macrosporangiidus]|uniref:Zn-ribbon domain-containing OB-fold protein n=1 Tax=Alicyclobacillus macrosporangiidus TaxID=392015 RepID=UPI0034E94595|nr:Zn-ribbon domain-containing OB-fold protein [Alicyclobacillus macrosporangiidus]